LARGIQTAMTYLNRPPRIASRQPDSPTIGITIIGGGATSIVRQMSNVDSVE
jgi:hypothetical protein